MLNHYSHNYKSFSVHSGPSAIKGLIPLWDYKYNDTKTR